MNLGGSYTGVHMYENLSRCTFDILAAYVLHSNRNFKNIEWKISFITMKENKKRG